MKSLIIKGFKKIEGTVKYDFNLIPFPKKIEEIQGYSKIKGNILLIFKNIERKKAIKERFQEELRKFTISESDEEIENIPQDLKFIIQEMIEESYNLLFQDELIIINAETDKGIYYGVNTFLQLLKLVDKKITIPRVNIYDYPTYKIRTITDNPSRNQVATLENLKKFIKFSSIYKLNYYFIYSEDVFTFEKYPDIGESRGGYSKSDLKELQEHAKKYFVEISPIFNSHGHVDNILMTNHPKYADLGEFPGSACYDITSPKLREFITDLYDELCETFESPVMHLGLDETFDFGKGKTKQIVEENGAGETLLEYYKFLIQLAKDRGKTDIMLYHDNVLGHKEVLEGLPKDTIVFYWNYWPEGLIGFRDKKKYKGAKKIADNGYRVILSPALYDWTRNYPDTRLTIKNIVYLAKYGLEIDAMGIATSVWGDFLNENLRENNYFGIMVTADATWGPEEWDEDRFKKNYAWYFFGLEDHLELFEAIECLNTYNDLNRLYPTKFFCHIWRHPFPTRKIKSKVKKLNLIQTNSQKAIDIIEKLETMVTKNKDNLEYMKFGAHLGIYFGLKYKIPIDIQNQLNKGKFELEEQFIEQITFLRDYISNLKVEYEKLWLNCSKRNGLDFLLKKFDAQKLFYEQKINQIKKGIDFKNPLLDSEFITYPSKIDTGEPVYLRKKFSINKEVESCFIQGMSDMIMSLSFNETELGEIISKMSLSVEPIMQRIQYFDVTDKIKQGDNIIAVECNNYLIQRPCANIYLEINYKNGGKSIVVSDHTWKSTITREKDWMKENFDDFSWLQAKSLGKPPKISGHVTKPYFRAGIKSQESSYYGMDSSMKSMIPFLPFFLINLGLKFVGLDIF